MTCPGILSATYTAVMEITVEVVMNDDFPGDKVGDLKPTGEPEAIDILDAYTLYCSKCNILTASEYADHGLADDWQML